MKEYDLDVNGAPILPPLKLSRDSALLGATDTLCDELGKLSPYDVARVLDEVTGNIASWPESFTLVWNAIAEVISRARDTQVPIDDLYLELRAGTPKETWVNPEGGHIGRNRDWSDGRILREVVAPWFQRRFQ